MSETPHSNTGAALPLFVNAAASIESNAMMANWNGTSGGVAAIRTWVANLIVYTPMSFTRPYPVRRVFWINGSTVTSTSVDFGIYSTGTGTRIYNTGSTTMTPASTVQYVAADFVIAPGSYYFAWTCNNTTARGYAPGGATTAFVINGMLEETTGGFGLPATMTPVAWTRAWGPSICGVTRTTTGF